jgi:hypothetical protein
MIALLAGILGAFLALWIALYKLQGRWQGDPRLGQDPGEAAATPIAGDRRVSWGKAFVDAAAAIGGLATAGALAAAVYTFIENDKLQRELAATGVWREYLSSAIASPELAEGTPADSDSVKYGWFVGHAFHAAEAIVLTQAEDTAWMAAVCETMEKHKRHIQGDDFPLSHYGG